MHRFLGHRIFPKNSSDKFFFKKGCCSRGIISREVFVATEERLVGGKGTVLGGPKTVPFGVEGLLEQPVWEWDANNMWECAGMPTMGYVIGELSRARRLDAGAARALGATGQALGQLKIGNDVVSFFVYLVWSLFLICCARCSLIVCFCITLSVCFGAMCGSTRRRRVTRVQTTGPYGTDKGPIALNPMFFPEKYNFWRKNVFFGECWFFL